MPLVPPGDVEALAGQLRAFLASPQAFLARAAALKERVAERFTVDNMTEQVVDFYIAELGAGLLTKAPGDSTR
jgi:glycosyltransferase involved in cell wall biosynthesis